MALVWIAFPTFLFSSAIAKLVIELLGSVLSVIPCFCLSGTHGAGPVLESCR
jgi:hypothetical protein